MLQRPPAIPAWLLVGAWCALDAVWPGLVRSRGGGGPPAGPPALSAEGFAVREAELASEYAYNLSKCFGEAASLHADIAALARQLDDLRAQQAKQSSDVDDFFLYTIGLAATSLLTHAVTICSFRRRRDVTAPELAPAAVLEQRERRRCGGFLQ